MYMFQKQRAKEQLRVQGNNNGEGSGSSSQHMDQFFHVFFIEEGLGVK